MFGLFDPEEWIPLKHILQDREETFWGSSLYSPTNCSLDFCANLSFSLHFLGVPHIAFVFTSFVVWFNRTLSYSTHFCNCSICSSQVCVQAPGSSPIFISASFRKYLWQRLSPLKSLPSNHFLFPHIPDLLSAVKFSMLQYSCSCNFHNGHQSMIIGALFSKEQYVSLLTFKFVLYNQNLYTFLDFA